MFLSPCDSLFQAQSPIEHAGVTVQLLPRLRLFGQLAVRAQPFPVFCQPLFQRRPFPYQSLVGDIHIDDRFCPVSFPVSARLLLPHRRDQTLVL